MVLVGHCCGVAVCVVFAVGLWLVCDDWCVGYFSWSRKVCNVCSFSKWVLVVFLVVYGMCVCFWEYKNCKKMNTLFIIR